MSGSEWVWECENCEFNHEDRQEAWLHSQDEGHKVVRQRGTDSDRDGESA